MITGTLHHWFLYPQALPLLALIPLLGVLALYARLRRRRALRQWGCQLRREAAPIRRLRTLLPAGLLTLGLSLLVVAIAAPRWGKSSEESLAPGRDIVVVLDLSRSMLAQDVLGTHRPGRLGRAEDALLDLADTIQHRGGHRLALVVFAARAVLLCPLTHDYDYFRESLRGLNSEDASLDIGPVAGQLSGTRLGAALQKAALAHDPRAQGHQDILLLSDGDDPANDDEWRQGVTAAREARIPVHTIGIGDSENSSPIPTMGSAVYTHRGQTVHTKLHEEPLMEIARQTGGVYVPARTKALPLGDLFRARIEPLPAHEPDEERLPTSPQHAAWFFAGALLCFTIYMVLGDRRHKRAKPRPEQITAEAHALGARA